MTFEIYITSRIVSKCVLEISLQLRYVKNYVLNCLWIWNAIIYVASVRYRKTGSLGKGVFSKISCLTDSREFGPKILGILEISQSVEDKGESDHVLEILESLGDMRDSRDSSSEKMPFVMTLFAVPELSSCSDQLSKVLKNS